MVEKKIELLLAWELDFVNHVPLSPSESQHEEAL